MSVIARRGFIKGAAAAGLAVAGIGAARAQDAAGAWPNRPVRFIVPLAAGGGIDFIARARRRADVAQHRPAGVRREPHRCRRHDRHRHGASRRARRLHGADHERQRRRARRMCMKLGSTTQGADAGDPAGAPAARAGGASLARGRIRSPNWSRQVKKPSRARAARPRAWARTSTCWRNGSSRGRGSSSTTCPIAAPARRSTTWSPAHVKIAFLGPTAHVAAGDRAGTISLLAQSRRSALADHARPADPARRPATRAWCSKPGMRPSLRSARRLRSSRGSMRRCDKALADKPARDLRQGRGRAGRRQRRASSPSSRRRTSAKYARLVKELGIRTN